MRMSTTGQVIIPQHIRDLLGITSDSEIDFQEDNRKVYLVTVTRKVEKTRFGKFRGIATARLATDQIMHLTRES